MRCNDCGDTNYRPPGEGRADICPACTDLRARLVAALLAEAVGLADFTRTQRALANSRGSGRGARAMRRALGEPQP
jgi:hypothetical protein